MKKFSWLKGVVAGAVISLFLLGACTAWAADSLELLDQTIQVAETDREREVVSWIFLQRFPELADEVTSQDKTVEELSQEVIIPETCLTPLHLEFTIIIDRLDPQIRDEISSALFDKPAHLTVSVSDANFQVWYCTDATAHPADAVNTAFAAKVLDYMAKSRTTEVTSWGFKEGGSDDESQAGVQQANKYQVHIYGLGGAYGVTRQLKVNPAGDDTHPRSLCTIGIAPTVTPDDLLLSTCAHEYHHASQFAYMNWTGYTLWALECTTTWIEYQVRKQYPAVAGNGSWNLFKARVEWHQDRPFYGLVSVESDTFVVTDTYDAGIWAWFLANNRIYGNRNIILKFWQKLEDKADWNKVFEAFDEALVAAGVPAQYNSFNKSYSKFVTANTVPAEWYPESIKSAHTFDLNLDTEWVNLPKTWQSQIGADPRSIWKRYGISYIKVLPGAKDRSLIVEFDGDDTTDFIVKLITLKNNQFYSESVLSLDAQRKGKKTPWVLKTDKIGIIAVARTSSSTGDFKVKLSALNILDPTQLAPANAGDKNNPKKINVKIEGPPPGTTKSELAVNIGGKAATIATLTELSDKYILKVEPPTQTNDGLYDLEVKYNPSGNKASATDTETDAVRYGPFQADIVLVIDRSGSMGSYGYMGPAKNAASQFVSFMASGDMVGVVSFSSSAGVNYPLTQIDGTGAQKAAAQAAIAGINSGGVTSIGAGLQVGQVQLTANGKTEDSHAMILLSDGYENRAPYVSTVLPGIPPKTVIYTIALGSNSDQALLQSIASQTGGLFFMSPSAGDLQTIYNQIAGAVAGQQSVASFSGAVGQGSTNQENVPVDDTLENTTFSVGWGGSDLDLTLKRPDGSIIDPTVAATDPSITFSSGSTFESYNIDSPMPGNWTLMIEGVTIPAGTENYTANVMGTTDLTLDVFFNKDDYSTGQPIGILASLSEGADPVIGAAVTVEVQAPTASLAEWISINGDTVPPKPLRSLSSTITLSLYDDGNHGDGAANDGVYGGRYINTATSGSYIFSVAATGTTSGGDSFSRTAQRSVFIPSPTATGSISGELTYAGSQVGTIYTGAWMDDPTMSGFPDYLVSQSFPGSYVVPNLPDGTHYIAAFMDVNGDGSQDANEPSGIYGSFDPVIVSGGAGTSGIDITLTSAGSPPTVDVISPLSGAAVSGIISISASATGDTGVVRVEFWYDSTFIASDTTNSYSVSWDTTEVSDGTCTLTAVAYDTQGLSDSDAISVIVDNTYPVVNLIDYPQSIVRGNLPKVEVTFSWEGSDDITPPENLVYQYKLEGHPDYESWSSWSSDTSKIYTLPLGDYTFKVRAKDGIGKYPGEDDAATAKYSFAVSLPIIVYPNPCYPNRGQVVTIANLPPNSKVYIYTISGELVRTLDGATEISMEGGSVTATWNLRNDAGYMVAKGIYVYLVLEATGGKKIGKIAVIK